MCKAPKPPKPKAPEKPEFLRNPYLDGAVGQSAVVQALRTGRSSLRIPLGSGLRIPGTELSPPKNPNDTFKPTPVNPKKWNETTRGIQGRIADRLLHR